MKVSTLIRKIERAGGTFHLHGRAVSVSGVPKRYQRLLRQQAYALKCSILEREAARKWDASGHNPAWWRNGQRPLSLPLSSPPIIRPRDVFEALKQILN